MREGALPVRKVLNRFMESNTNYYHEEDDWRSSLDMSINATRLLYGVVVYALENWPGSPARPAIEQEFLQSMKNTLFGQIMEYNMEYNTANKKNGDSD